MCCNIKYVKKYITVKIIKIDLINFERNFIGPSVPIKSKQNHATFGHSWNHNKDLAILCFYRYFNYQNIFLKVFSRILLGLTSVSNVDKGSWIEQSEQGVNMS